MESNQGENEGEWVHVNSEVVRRKSIASEFSVNWPGEGFASFEEVSLAVMYNQTLKRGKKRVSETGDANCGDRKRFCSLGVDFIMRTTPSMEGLLSAINGDFSNVLKMVNEMSLGGFIAAMSSEETMGMLELVLKLRSSIEQETLECCSRMRETIMQNVQTNESDFDKRIETLELWPKVGCDVSETLQKQITANKEISAQASNSAQIKAEEMHNRFEKWRKGEIKKMKENVTQTQEVFTKIIVNQNADQAQRMNVEVRDLEKKVGFPQAHQRQFEKIDDEVFSAVSEKVCNGKKNLEWLQNYLKNFGEV